MAKTQPTPMHPDKAMASLAFATHLQNQMLEHQAPTKAPQNSPAPQGGMVGSAPEERAETKKPDENETKMTRLELDMTKKMDDLRKELDDKHKLELDSLRNDIKEALDEEETDEQA